MYRATRCPRCLAHLPTLCAGEPPLVACPFCQENLQARERWGEPLTNRRCQQCGSPLTPDESAAGPRCSRESCQDLNASLQAAASERKYWKQYYAQQRAEIARGFQEELQQAGELDSTTHSLVVVVPNYQQKLTVLGDDRKQKFLARLAGLAHQVFHWELKAEYVPNEEFEESSNSAEELLREQVTVACCTTCGGYCCSHGGEHAFQDIDSLRHRREQFGWNNEEEVVEAYRALLPVLSHEDSCVFHTSTGCALPRAMRSFTCNDFVCAGLDDFAQQRTSAKEVSEIGVVSQLNGERLRSTVLKSPEWQLLKPTPPEEIESNDSTIQH